MEAQHKEGQAHGGASQALHVDQLGAHQLIPLPFTASDEAWESGIRGPRKSGMEALRGAPPLLLPLAESSSMSAQPRWETGH